MINIFSKNSKSKEIAKESTMSSLAAKILIQKNDIDKIRPYLDKLKQTIDSTGINNIALTGSYGSGKSTILQTFRSLHTEYEYLNISLASFNNKQIKDDDEQDENKKRLKREELERLLEVSILQQIFYHVKPSDIPESRFKRIINIPAWKLWGISLGFTVWLFSIVLLIKYNYLDKLNPSKWNVNNSVDWFSIFIFLITFLGIGLFSKAIVELFSNSKISKVNIKGELELGESITKSVFNEHLEEILYFFERTKYNVVIIEDLDRFDSTDIFTKLREINILLNNSKLINREIKFVYAVGDDLFSDKKERVKFFEYIIPVISFINSSNAEEQLKRLIKESGLSVDIFPKEFLSDVITFIDDIDMRLLINIFHEFVIYRNTLKPEFIKKEEELFSIIVYKNIDPEDFNKLNSKEGKLYRLITNKGKYLVDLISEIDNLIEQKTQEIKNIEGENISEIAELKTIYLNKIISQLPYGGLVNKSLSSNEFDKIIDGKKISYNVYESYNLYNREFKFDFSKIEKEVNPTFTYSERIKLIESKTNDRVGLLKKEISDLKSKKSEIQRWDLKQVFKEIDINKYLKDFANNRLLRNLILEGYLNENYNDYISLFHEVSLTKDDFNFERNVKSGFDTEFNYKLTNIETLLNKIDIKYFERETILNFDLLDYLGKNYRGYSSQYDSIIKLLSNEKERSIGFIDEYLKDEDRPLRILVEKLTSSWRGWWDFIYLKSNYTKEKEDYYLSLMIRFAKIDDLVLRQNENTLTRGIVEKSNFLSLVHNTAELNYFSKISELIKRLNIKFEKLDDVTPETKELFDYVYKNHHYQINSDNILQMLRTYGNTIDENSFEKSNYSTIMSSDCKSLVEYIDSDINTYIENVYLNIEENKFEEEESLIELLNIDELSNDLKDRIIKKVETKISDISSIEDVDIKRMLLLNDRVVYVWDNVIAYYNDSENTFDDILLKYLEFDTVVSELSKKKLVKENEVFEGDLLICNDISDEVYNQLIDSCYFRYKSLDFEKLSKNKVLSLVRKILTMTKSNYDSLREHFPYYHITLVENHFNIFINSIDEYQRDDEDVLVLLQSDRINDKNKLEFIDKLDLKIIVGNNEIAKFVGIIILNNYSREVKVDYTTLVSLVKNSTSSDSRINLINKYSKSLADNELIDLVKGVGNLYNELFEKQHKPKLNNTDINRTLFEELKNRGLIKDYDVDKKDEDLIRVIANY